MEWMVSSVENFFAVVSLTGFLKFLVALTLIRVALGLRGPEMGVVVVVLALVLAGTQVPSQGAKPSYASVFQATNGLRDEVSPPATLKEERLAENKQIAQFLLRELSTGLTVGLSILIPCIVLELLVANVLTALGIVSLESTLIALPLKILLFLSVDGWNLVATKLGVFI